MVRIHPASSRSYTATSGVPQWFHLGSSLINVVVHHLHGVAGYSDDFVFFFFTDATKIFRTTGALDAVALFQSGLDDIALSCDQN